MNAHYTYYAMLADAVLEIEREMRQLALWIPEGSPEEPTPEALASDQPFCIDTLSFPQWVQFVLLVRVRALIEAGAQLPDKSDIAPMAEEYFGQLGQPADNLVDSIRQLDRLITEA